MFAHAREIAAEVEDDEGLEWAVACSRTRGRLPPSRSHRLANGLVACSRTRGRLPPWNGIFLLRGYGRDAARALTLAALLHDVGRFEQYERYRTFADPVSYNHGSLGASIVRKEAFLKRETPEIRRLAILTFALHNRYSLPGRLSGKLRAVLEALRDADKLDILPVTSMATN